MSNPGIWSVCEQCGCVNGDHDRSSCWRQIIAAERAAHAATRERAETAEGALGEMQNAREERVVKAERERREFELMWKGLKSEWGKLAAENLANEGRAEQAEAERDAARADAAALRERAENAERERDLARSRATSVEIRLVDAEAALDAARAELVTAQADYAIVAHAAGIEFVQDCGPSYPGPPLDVAKAISLQRQRAEDREALSMRYRKDMRKAWADAAALRGALRKVERVAYELGVNWGGADHHVDDCPGNCADHQLVSRAYVALAEAGQLLAQPNPGADLLAVVDAARTLAGRLLPVDDVDREHRDDLVAALAKLDGGGK